MSAHTGAAISGASTRTEALAEPLNLYRFPALYDSLKTPCDHEVQAVRTIIQRFVGPSPWSILDPACGPGNWLRPFVGEARLAGNDNCPEMVEYTRETTGAHTVLGDMFDLKFDQPFDVILEAGGVTYLLSDVETLRTLIGGFRPLLNQTGVVILLLHFDAPVPARLPATLWRTDWQHVPHGKARIRYELVDDNRRTLMQRIRRTVETRGPYPPRIVETYDLRVWHPDELNALRNIDGLELTGCIDPSRPDDLNAYPVGERLLVFRAV